MISLLISFAVLIVGFIVYGKVTERIFAPDDRPTPTVAINGGVLAVAGIIICPITSGDTAFRSARLVLAETFKLEQKHIKKPSAHHNPAACCRRSADVVRFSQRRWLPDCMALFLVEQSDFSDGRSLGSHIISAQ